MSAEPVRRLLEYYDCEDSFELLSQFEDDSTVPGVCLSCLTIIEEVEPDAANNWCPNCLTNHVKSSFVLLNII
jgi:hypothetical protein